MDSASFGSFQQQIKRNQDDLTDYLKDLDSWKETISKKDSKLLSGATDVPDSSSHPPVRNSLHKKKKVRRKKAAEPAHSQPKAKPTRIPGHDFRAWDQFDVEKALDEVERQTDSESSYEEDTDEEWEEERMKQQAIFEKDQGNDYYKKNKLNEAIDCYTKGITCDPTNAILYANRAMALLKQEKYGAVEQDCTDAIALDPTYVKAYMRRGTARQRLKKYQAALGDFTQAVKLEPENKMAQRELAALEQELKISEEGLVIPVKKAYKERSKKPLRRIEIEEIDHDDMKQKLNAAVSRTTELESAEKKRIIAQDDALFDKYISGERTNNDTSLQSENLNTEKDVKHNFSSPADIGQSSLNGVSEAERESDCGQVSPRTSPRAPANSYQFQRDWTAVKDDLDQAYEYLKLIPASDLPTLIGEFLEADVMSTLLKVFHLRFMRDGIDVLGYMLHLAKVKRFSMIVMFMCSSDKQIARLIVDKLSISPGMAQEDIQKLKRMYEL